MSDRTDSSGATVAIVVILLLILLLVTGGLGTYVLIARQRAVAVEVMEVRAVMAAREAEVNAQVASQREEEARALAEFPSKQTQPSATIETTPATGDPTLSASIETVLRTQAEAWNAGKIDEFMQHYWKSDELTFSSGGKITRGWTDTRNRYNEKYPTPEKMGKLTFDGLEIKALGDSAALVLGRWNLQRETEPLTGNFSLVMQKMNGQWLIIHDHTSRLAE